MTLGGLSLAVGILVDEATVVIENIHTQMGKQRFARPRRPGRHRGDDGAEPAGDAVHPGGVPAVVPDGRGGARPVRAAGHLRRLRHDHRLHPVDHLRAGAVDLAAAPSARGSCRPSRGRASPPSTGCLRRCRRLHVFANRRLGLRSAVAACCVSRKSPSGSRDSPAATRRPAATAAASLALLPAYLVASLAVVLLIGPQSRPGDRSAGRFRPVPAPDPRPVRHAPGDQRGNDPRGPGRDQGHGRARTTSPSRWPMSA